MLAYNFVVHIISAADLAKKKASASVRLSLGGASSAQSSSVKTSDKGAVWNETFSLSGSSNDSQVTFEIVDPKGHCLGMGSLPVAHLVAVGVYDGAVPLSGAEGPAGSLRVRVTVERGV